MRLKSSKSVAFHYQPHPFKRKQSYSQQKIRQYNIQSNHSNQIKHLHKRKHQKSILPIQRSLLYLDWSDQHQKQRLQTIKEKSQKTLESIHNKRQRFKTDLEDNGKIESKYKKKKCCCNKVKKQQSGSYYENQVYSSNTSRIKVSHDFSLNKIESKPSRVSSKSVEKILLPRMQSLTSANRYKINSKNFIQSTCVTNQTDHTAKKTLFDWMKRIKKQKQPVNILNQFNIPLNISILDKKIPSVPSLQQTSKFIKQYKKLNQNFKLDFINPNFVVVNSNNSLYFGMHTIVNGKKVRHDEGVYLTQNSLFEGKFQNNSKKQGYELRKAGLYMGSFKDNKRSGKGQFIWHNGEYYNGEWRENMKHGSGIWTSSYKQENPDTYIGEWKEGRVDGYGVHSWKNGSNRYEGEFVNFLKHGKGVERFENGDRYEGQYREGKPNRYGQYYWVDGSHYKGDFKDGIRDGRGVYYQTNGNRYIGQYVNDCKQGRGTIYYADKSSFDGMFIADKKHGQGCFITNKGDIINGIWKQSKITQQF